MSPTKEHLKILSTLSLAASDAREDTLKSVVISTLMSTNNCERKNLGKTIEQEFGFQPYPDELQELLNKLIYNGEILTGDSEIVYLSDEAKLQQGTAETKLKDREKQRFENFSNFIIEHFAETKPAHIKLLWSTFIEYLYNHFYDYGEEALKRLHPFIEYDKKFEKEEDYQQIAYAKLKDEKLCHIFKFATEKFPDYASNDDLDFLNDLANKTLSFASLGISPDLSATSIDLSLVDWVLYLDTNVLYSLLDLHSHPENEACKALVKLINDNHDHLNIVLRYSELTKKELNAKRDDFGLLDDKLTDSGIRALLRSDKLDDFSTQFYTNLLEDRDSTIHPSNVIDLSPNILKKSAIDIARNAKRIDQIGEEYIQKRIEDYQSFITKKNDIKEQWSEEKGIKFYPIFKSDKQITHDITLRELLLHLRASNVKNQEEVTFNSVKYFGVTLDSLLREYDTKQTKNYEDERSFPIFFRPSYLLSKLVRVLPVKTQDYKKAFIKAVTSKGFNKDVRKSQDVLRIVNYLKSQGIDNESVVYNLITEEIFLEKYKNHRTDKDFDEGEFIQNELNREFKAKEEALKQVEERNKKAVSQAKETLEQKEALENKSMSLREELELYKDALKKVTKDIGNLQKQKEKEANEVHPKLDFEGESIKKQLKTTENRLRTQIEGKIRAHKEQMLRKWQNRTWLNLFWIVPITCFGSLLVLFPNLFRIEGDTSTARWLIGLITLIVDGVFVYIIKMRFFDEKNKGAKLASFETPSDLQKELDEL